MKAWMAPATLKRNTPSDPSVTLTGVPGAALRKGFASAA